MAQQWGIHFITVDVFFESAVIKFKDIILLLLSFSMPCAITVQSNYLNSPLTEVDYIFNTFTSTLRMTLDDSERKNKKNKAKQNLKSDILDSLV